MSIIWKRLTVLSVLLRSIVGSNVLSLQSCENDAFSEWSLFADGAIQSVANSSMCISGVSGLPLVAVNCVQGNVQQGWFFHSDGTVRSANNSTCWNIPGQSITPGTDILAYPCGLPINENLVFSYSSSTKAIFANQSGLCIRWNGLNPPVPTVLNVTAAPCFADNTGISDATSAIQLCINLGYSTLPPTALFFPVGTYLVSDTLTIAQTNPGPDDGINVVPARFLSHVLFGSTAMLPSRPTLRLAPASPGFGDSAHYKPVVKIFNSGGQGVDMNNLFRGINVDLTAPGNPGAVGVSHPGAQGSTVADVTVQVCKAW